MAAAGSLEEAQEMYAAYIAAEKKVLSGQSYQIRDRMLTMADIKEIREGAGYWYAQITARQGDGNVGGINIMRFVPVDD